MDAGEGCCWERQSGLGGTLGEVITNDFVSTPGQRFVSILASDVGFYADEDCGIWTRT
jgi:hypothetical protein